MPKNEENELKWIHFQSKSLFLNEKVYFWIRKTPFKLKSQNLKMTFETQKTNPFF